MNKFILNTFSPLINPKKYYTDMPAEGGFFKSIIRVSIYGIINGLINGIKILLILPSLAFPVNKLIAPDIAMGLSFINSFIITTAFFLMGGFFVFIMSVLCKGNKKIKLSFKISASITLLVPINSLLQYVNMYYHFIGIFFTAFTLSLAIWMLYNALIEGQKAERKRAKIGSIMLFLIINTFFIYNMINFKEPKNEKNTEIFKKEIEKNQIFELFDNK